LRKCREAALGDRALNAAFDGPLMARPSIPTIHGLNDEGSFWQVVALKSDGVKPPALSET